MSADKPGNPSEQFVLLAKTAKGMAAVELIKQVLEAPGVYVFGELLDMPSIQELANGPHQAYFSLLNLFAFGTCADYRSNKADLPELSGTQGKKLQHLTVVSLATKNKCLPYSLLLAELDIRNVRELEDLIIEVIYADVIRGKLDQQNQQLEVDYAIGRDIRPEAVSDIVNVLQEWCNGCEAVLSGIETQIIKANSHKETQLRMRQQIETDVTNIKKTLKTAQPQEGDEQMVTDSRELPQSSDKSSKKAVKTKALRGSGKLWTTKS
ncbi:hypothetical protein CAPTEDRAFT_168475 [Capitella teleta]|uniref:PCI domain-containing protein n=1 Tax=Capitella teleta TaxID=283909 RepID=R7UT66_CAPTE|nr:hypothetical protein CAPTEDRAFT_168475 [Capitella teleta]|eukprot:ELU07097.1 hypothetical protein CAPTEDRAFT_168475 [Capitella teleta]